MAESLLAGGDVDGLEWMFSVLHPKFQTLLNTLYELDSVDSNPRRKGCSKEFFTIELYQESYGPMVMVDSGNITLRPFFVAITRTSSKSKNS